MSGQTANFEKLALIGIGLIGSSIALAARRLGVVREISIQTRSPETLATARRLALGDRYTHDMAEAVADADLVIVCVPVGACEAVARSIGPVLKSGAIVSDVGSVKGAVIAQMGPHIPAHAHFVPAHPIAGTEHSGPDAGFWDLFQNRWCILTPQGHTHPSAIDAVAAFWRAIGADIDIMDPVHHDLVLAATSHLPHLIAYNIVGTAADLEEVTNSEVIKYSAAGFRDFTRLAASDPTMWRDVCLHNRPALLEMLGRFMEDLSALQRAVRWGEADQLFDLFTRTRAVRRAIIDAGQEVDAPDFGRHALDVPGGHEPEPSDGVSPGPSK